jgi:hypothetical protein
MSNNGMHPTADTLPVMFLYRLGAAGDARVMRYLWSVEEVSIWKEVSVLGWSVFLRLSVPLLLSLWFQKFGK